MTITIYEFILITQPDVLVMLRAAGLLVGQRPAIEENLTHADIIALMRHDHWRRIRGALRQVYGRVIG